MARIWGRMAATLHRNTTSENLPNWHFATKHFESEYTPTGWWLAADSDIIAALTETR